MTNRKLQIAIFINNFSLPAWMYEMLVQVTKSGVAEIAVVVKNGAGSNQSRQGFSLYNLYRKFENKTSKVFPDALAMKSIDTLVQQVPVITLTTDKDGIAPENLVQQLGGYNLDVCLKLGFRKLDGNILQAAKYGVWAYGFNNANTNDAVPAGVWEVIENQPVTGCALLRLKQGGSSEVLYSSFGATNISIKRSLNLSYWKAASFVKRKLQELSLGGTLIPQAAETPDIKALSSPNHKHPGNIAFGAYLLKHYRNKLLTKLGNYFSFQQWRLLYTFKEKGAGAGDLRSYKSIIPPKDRFWADPFAFTQNKEQYYIFVEELVYGSKKAHIAVMELDNTGRLSAPAVVLDKPYHLSYPFLFRDGGEVYMIPETSANKTVEVYKSTSFPHKWEWQMNLMENLHAVDTTIHYHNNKYWLFTNIKENKGASAWDELFIFYADELLTTNWTAHKKNPVISDVRTSRPAGNFFVQNNKLYRPSQDCSVTYGYAANINEVLVLNEEDYAEICVEKILPDWGEDAVAVHTFSRCEELSVVDVRFKVKK